MGKIGIFFCGVLQFSRNVVPPYQYWHGGTGRIN